MMDDISTHEITLDDGSRGSFTYWYEHVIRHEGKDMDIGDFFVNFEFDDGSWMRRAFQYHWRVWPMHLVHELMHEVGFRKIEIYVDYCDDKGLYRHGKTPVSLQEWNESIQEEDWVSAYVVARK
eukprot:Tamp_17283.p2 GENE.Tamp_17283~~Tamp_17283.p2  ORF type:complete len:124 (-),score=30.37 Tamp_17283:80-451(-)